MHHPLPWAQVQQRNFFSLSINHRCSRLCAPCVKLTDSLSVFACWSLCRPLMGILLAIQTPISNFHSATNDSCRESFSQFVCISRKSFRLWLAAICHLSRLPCCCDWNRDMQERKSKHSTLLDFFPDTYFKHVCLVPDYWWDNRAKQIKTRIIGFPSFALLHLPPRSRWKYLMGKLEISRDFWGSRETHWIRNFLSMISSWEREKRQ